MTSPTHEPLRQEPLRQERLPYLLHRHQETWVLDPLRKGQEGPHRAALTGPEVGQVEQAGLQHVVEARHSLKE